MGFTKRASRMAFGAGSDAAIANAMAIPNMMDGCRSAASKRDERKRKSDGTRSGDDFCPFPVELAPRLLRLEMRRVEEPIEAANRIVLDAESVFAHLAP